MNNKQMLDDIFKSFDEIFNNCYLGWHIGNFDSKSHDKVKTTCNPGPR